MQMSTTTTNVLHYRSGRQNSTTFKDANSLQSPGTQSWSGQPCHVTCSALILLSEDLAGGLGFEPSLTESEFALNL